MKGRNFFSILLVLVIILNQGFISSYAQNERDTNVTSVPENTARIYSNRDYVIVMKLINNSKKGFAASLSVHNISNEINKDWKILLTYNGFINKAHNALISDGEYGRYYIEGLSANKDIPIGNSVCFGIESNQHFTGFPEKIELLPGVSEIDSKDYGINYSIVSDNGKGFLSTLLIYNNSNEYLTDWELDFNFKRNITDIRNAAIISHEGNKYTLKSLSQDAIAPKAFARIKFFGEGGKHEDYPSSFHLLSRKSHKGSINIDNSGENSGNKKNDDSMPENKPVAEPSPNPEVNTGDDNIPSEINTPEQKKVINENDNPIDVNLPSDKPNTEDSYDNNDDPKSVSEPTASPEAKDPKSVSEPTASPEAKDSDSDGLYDDYETEIGTDLYNPDTDNDCLSDYDEVMKYKSDPLNPDTDGDGLSDYDDIVLDFSPLSKDTDGNGICDPDEIKEQVRNVKFSDDAGHGIECVSVSMKTNGNIDNKVTVTNMYDTDRMSTGVVGLVGVPVEIKSEVPFDEATITFTYDESMLGDVNEENLSVMWYDEANNWYRILDEESVVDTKKNTVSYTTTHFSTYMLVDRAGWYEAWRENVDYSLSDSDDTVRHNFDIAIMVNSSPGVASGDEKLKEIACNFIDSLEDEDLAVVVPFQEYSALNQYRTDESYLRTHTLTSDKDALHDAVKDISFTGGGIDIDNCLRDIYRVFHPQEGASFKYPVTEEGEEERIPVAVILTVGCNLSSESELNDIAWQRVLALKIPVYVIDIQAETSYTGTLRYIAEQTGGQYMRATDSDNFSELLGTVINVPAFDFDTTDTDGDGLYDVYETAGIKLSNGRVIYTDPNKEDTDGDGLSDYEETGIVFNIDDRYVGNYTTKDVKYFVLRSDPTLVDTDGDGVSDKDDDKPLIREVVEFRLNVNHGNQYLNIVDSNGNSSPAGNQNWWPSTGSGFLDYKSDLSTRINELGCGVIALTDVELYLAQRNGYVFTYPYPTEYFNSNTGAPYYNSINSAIDKDEYMKYVEYNCQNKYKLGGTVQYISGVLPTDMDYGISNFMITNNNPHDDVSWAPYFLMSKFDEKICVAEKMETMLKNNIPIVFAYYSPTGKEINLYNSVNGAHRRLENDIYTTVNSHYMTVIGLTRYLSDDGKSYEYVMKITSCGQIKYINYDDYAKSLSFLSNILAID